MSADDLAARRARALATPDTSGTVGAYTADDALLGISGSPVRSSRPVAIPTEADRLNRVSGPAALATADEWETAPRPAPETYDAAAAQIGYGQFVSTLAAMLVDAERMSERVLGVNARVEHEGELAAAAYLVDQLATLRADLARIEHGIVLAGSKALRRHPELERQGTLPDGRQFELRRGNTRKAWQHDDWQRDVRAKVLDAVSDSPLVDPATGEEVDVRRMVAAAVETAQSVHGSTGPKVTALRALALDPGDYAEQTPGLWSFDLSAPATTPTTSEGGPSL